MTATMYNMCNLFATFVTLLTLMTASQTEAMGYGGCPGYQSPPPAVYAKYMSNVPDIHPSIYSYIFNHNPPPSAFYRGLPPPYYVERNANPPPTSFYGYGGYGGY